MGDVRPFRVLSLDGGGMRGTYTATYLSSVANAFAGKRGIAAIDLGRAFDLIVGTSTGGIIACGLVAGIPLDRIANLYGEHGKAIFRRPVPNRLGCGLLLDHVLRGGALSKGTEALKSVLTKLLGDETIGQVYQRRGIAIAITAVEMSNHRSWVFKSKHLSNSVDRDGGYSLVDVCLATSAAPVFRSMHVLKRPNGVGENVFIDGGLWANNPVLVGMTDAIQMASADQPIEIYCIGSCPMPPGEQVNLSKLDRGLPGWKYGSEVASVSIAAQEFAFDNIARMLSGHVHAAGCRVLRFPRDQAPADMLQFLSLDDTRDQAISALIRQARADADMTNSRCADANNPDAQMICKLFTDAPPQAEGEE